LKTIILPKRNELDLEDVPDEIRKSLSFVFAESVNDVLKAALQKPIPTRKKPQPGKKNEKSTSGG